MNHFTVTGENEAGVDVVFIQSFPLCYANHVDLMLTTISNHKYLLVGVGFPLFYELIYIKWGNPTKEDFPAIISTVEYSSGYLLLNTRVSLQENEGPQFRENYIIAKGPKCDQFCASFQSSSKIYRMLITRSVAYNESRHDSYPQFPRSPLGTPGTMGRHTKKKNSFVFRVSLC